jgi:hypothetical protein
MDVPTLMRTLHTYPVVFTDVVLTRRGTTSLSRLAPILAVATWSGPPTNKGSTVSSSVQDALVVPVGR